VQATRALAGIAVAGLAGYTLVALGLDGPRGFGARWAAWGLGAVLLGLGLWLAPRTTARGGLLVVVLGAIAFRAVLIPAPIGSDDLNRYLWDGRVQAEGINPYRFAPADDALAELRDDRIWPEINRAEVRTIYPPAAQATFRLGHALGLRSPATFKLVPTAADVGAIALLVALLRRAGRDPRLAVAYAWNPVTILGFAHSGHIDSLVVVALLGAVWTWGWPDARRAVLATGALLGLAASVKLWPLALLPAFARRPEGTWRWAAALPAVAVGVLAVGYLPFLPGVGTEGVLGFLPGYLEEEGFTSGTRSILFRRLGLEHPLVAPLAGLAVVAAVLRSRRDAAVRAAWIVGGAFVIATPPYSWYTTSLVALAVAGGAGWLWTWLAVGYEAAYIALFFRPLELRLSFHIRFALSLLVIAALVAAVRSRRARAAVLGRGEEPACSA
jgi:hypothetical protein